MEIDYIQKIYIKMEIIDLNSDVEIYQAVISGLVLIIIFVIIRWYMNFDGIEVEKLKKINLELEYKYDRISSDYYRITNEFKLLQNKLYLNINMNKETIEKVISITKDINTLKNFINNLKDKNNTLTLQIYSKVFETTFYDNLNPSNEIYNEVVNDFIRILENKLKQLEKELEIL